MNIPSINMLKYCALRITNFYLHAQHFMDRNSPNCVTTINALLVFSGCVLISGCPLNSQSIQEENNNDARRIEYNLVETQAKLLFTFDLFKCEGNEIRVTPTAQLITSAAADKSKIYAVDISNLDNSLTERDLTITLYEHGAIKTVNSSTSDKTFALIGNILKTATILAGGFSPGEIPDKSSTKGVACTPDIDKALTHRNELVARVNELRTQLNSIDIDEAESMKQTIDLYATEIARLNTDVFRITLEKKVDLSNPNISVPQSIAWKESDFKKWTSSTDDTVVDGISFDVALTLVDPTAGSTTSNSTSLNPTDCPNDTGCLKTLVFREPLDVKLGVHPTGRFIVDKNGGGMPKEKSIFEQTIPVSQWGHRSFVPLDASLGSTTTVSISLDAYGRKSSFGWKSNARANAIFEGVSSGLEQYSKLQTVREGKSEFDLAAEKLKELETYKKLNELLDCEQIINAGGFQCPPPQ